MQPALTGSLANGASIKETLLTESIKDAKEGLLLFSAGIPRNRAVMIQRFVIREMQRCANVPFNISLLFKYSNGYMTHITCSPLSETTLVSLGNIVRNAGIKLNFGTLDLQVV